MKSAALFPNRKLGLGWARTAPTDAYDPNCMAAIALSNLRVGESIPLAFQPCQVISIGRTMQVQTGEGKRIRIRPDSPQWTQVVRDVGGHILAASHGAGRHAGDLLTALDRDPAVRQDPQGVRYIQDPGAQ